MLKSCLLLCFALGSQALTAEPVVEQLRSEKPVLTTPVLIHWLQGWHGAYSRDLEPDEASELALFSLLNKYDLDIFSAFLMTGLFADGQPPNQSLKFTNVEIPNTVTSQKYFLRELYRRRQFEGLKRIALAIDAPELTDTIREAAAIYIGWLYEDTLGWSFSLTMSQLSQINNPRIRFAVVEALKRAGHDWQSFEILMGLAQDNKTPLSQMSHGSPVAFAEAIREVAQEAVFHHQLTEEMILDLLGPPAHSEPALGCYDLLGGS